MNVLASARVDGRPGPKGSVNAFCIRCATRKLPQKVAVQEQSDVGALFRRVIKRELSRMPLPAAAAAGPVETRFVFFIERRKVVRKGVETSVWIPSHSGPYPTHQQSGDVEKHIRTAHDALMDAGVILDDSQVWRTTAEKRWADADNPPGVVLEVRTA